MILYLIHVYSTGLLVFFPDSQAFAVIRQNTHSPGVYSSLSDSLRSLGSSLRCRRGSHRPRLRHLLVDHHCRGVSWRCVEWIQCAHLSAVPCPEDRRCQSRRSSGPTAQPWARPAGRGTPIARSESVGNPLGNGRTSKYGCFSASSTSIRLFGLNVKHFSIRSIACERAHEPVGERSSALPRHSKAKTYQRIGSRE